MTAQTFSNSAQTTLSALANAGDASISVASATGFPTTTPYTILVDSEYLLVTSGAGTTTWGVTRAQEGSSAGTHVLGATVTQVVTLAGLNSLNDSFWPSMGVSGLTGAVQPSRYVGATTSGAPGSGTFAVGDVVVDRTGSLWTCYAAGSPGSFIRSDGFLGNTTFGIATASWTSPTIPAGWSTIEIDLFLRGDTAATGTAVQVQANGDTGTNYDYELLSYQGTGNTTVSGVEGHGVAFMRLVDMPAATGPAKSFAGARITVPNYVDATHDKVFFAQTAIALVYSAGNAFVYGASGWWHGTSAALTSIKLTPAAGSFAAGSSFTTRLR